MPQNRPGGYEHFGQLIGRPPIGVGIASEAAIQRSTDTVFRDLGASVCVANGPQRRCGKARCEMLRHGACQS
jgi:hypothetical protein